MGIETFDRSLWSALTPALDAGPSLQGDHDTDVLVVGAGFLGLSTALHLAEAGVRVTVLEAEQPGFGASGRNTGFVVPSLKTAFGPADVRDALGETGDRLTELVGSSGNLVFDLIRRLGIECSAEQTGWLQPAHTGAVMKVLEQRQADWLALGRGVDILTPEETAEMVGTPGYHGALLDRTGGQINPLAYARGLAAVARRLGANLFWKSRVTKLQRNGGRWLAETAAGGVRADRVILTTNALVGGLVPEVEASMIPVRVHQVATAPLSPELGATILPMRTPVADTRRHTFAVRWSPDGRLVTGGLVLPGPANLRRATRIFSRRLERAFPMLGQVRIDHVWNGVIAATLDSLPRFMSVEPGLDAVIGCNGRGVALTTALGRDIARLHTGEIDISAFPLPHKAPTPVPARAITRHGPSFWLPWSDFRDRLDGRRG
ncbi:Glycine/D-amino acid oxidase [Faunimonas pinastri]|uniref:Glycine/D-amino acid oxidase n=1 Tax=Faunimonas pinastri TaxID=1855383 RepID=A0A1H9E7E1_9HYPH|nr:FAD-binding oxidoreductase [Faunimonas pinastri]SEQ21674.1 Glycine/D-amino acid oxidase [Faunimonas pinastri]